MDGVLIESGGVYERHWAAWAATHDVDPQHISRVHPGRPPRETIRIVAPHLDAIDEAARFDAALADDAAEDEITAMPGARSLVHDLPAGRWTIATSARRAIAELWLRSVGLPIPAELVPVDDVSHGKPSPEPYLRAAQLLGLDPTSCLVIEDAPAGITAAKAAGAQVLALRTTHLDADLQASDALADDLRAVSVHAAPHGLWIAWG